MVDLSPLLEGDSEDEDPDPELADPELNEIDGMSLFVISFLLYLLTSRF